MCPGPSPGTCVWKKQQLAQFVTKNTYYILLSLWEVMTRFVMQALICEKSYLILWMSFYVIRGLSLCLLLQMWSENRWLPRHGTFIPGGMVRVSVNLCLYYEQLWTNSPYHILFSKLTWHSVIPCTPWKPSHMYVPPICYLLKNKGVIVWCMSNQSHQTTTKHHSQHALPFINCNIRINPQDWSTQQLSYFGTK